MSFLWRRPLYFKIVLTPPKWLSTMYNDVAGGKLTKSLTGGRFLVSPDDLQVSRRRRGPAGNAVDHRWCCLWWFNVLCLTLTVHNGVLGCGL